MNRPIYLILGLALVLAFAMTLGFPGASQAQQNDPAASYGPAGQDYNSGYYGANCRGYRYSPKASGYGYSAPATQDNQQYTYRPRNRGCRSNWRSVNSDYYQGYRGGCCR